MGGDLMPIVTAIRSALPSSPECRRTSAPLWFLSAFSCGPPAVPPPRGASHYATCQHACASRRPAEGKTTDESPRFARLLCSQAPHSCKLNSLQLNPVIMVRRCTDHGGTHAFRQRLSAILLTRSSRCASPSPILFRSAGPLHPTCWTRGYGGRPAIQGVAESAQLLGRSYDVFIGSASLSLSSASAMPAGRCDRSWALLPLMAVTLGLPMIEVTAGFDLRAVLCSFVAEPFNLYFVFSRTYWALCAGRSFAPASAIGEPFWLCLNPAAGPWVHLLPSPPPMCLCRLPGSVVLAFRRTGEASDRASWLSVSLLWHLSGW